MKTYWTLEQDVLAYLGRKAEDLPSGMLLRSINIAKDHLQRLIDFEFAQQRYGPLSFPYELRDIKNVRLAVDENGEKLLVLSRRQYEDQRYSRCLVLENNTLYAIPEDMKATLYVTVWLPDFAPYTYVEPTPFLENGYITGLVDKPYENLPLPRGVRYPKGSDVEINGVLTSVTSTYGVLDNYLCNVEPILQPSGDLTARLCQHPFILDYAYDYLLLRALYELNFFLKEEERAELVVPMMERALEQVILWNGSLVNNPVDVSLS